MESAMNKFARSAKQIQRFGKDVEKTGRQITKVGTNLTKAVTTPILALGAGAIKTAADFEQGMSKVQSICQGTPKQMDKLAQKAKEMGQKTKFSAREAADAFTYMGMAGWKTKEMLGGIEGVMYLSGATGEGLAETADIVTDAMTSFKLDATKTSKVFKDELGGIKEEVNNTTRFVDVLAQTARSSNTDVHMLGESFKYCSSIAGEMNYSVEDVGIALGTMANSGIKASKSGVYLKTAIQNMSKPTDDQYQAMVDLGIATGDVEDKTFGLCQALYDENGNAKSLGDAMDTLREKFQGLSNDNQKIAYATTIFGKQASNGMLKILGAEDEAFNKLRKSIYESNGAAKEMYDVANDNLMGQLTILKSTVESIAIAFGDRLLPVVKKAVSFIQGLANKFANLNKTQQNQIIKFALLAAAAGPAIAIFGKITTGVGKTISKFGRLGYLLGHTDKLMKAIFSPGHIVVAVLLAIGAAVYIVIKHWDKFKDTFQKIEPVLKRVAEGISNAISKFIEKAKQVFESCKEPIGNFINILKDGFLAILPHIKKGASTILNFGKSVWGVIKKIPGAIKSLPNTIKQSFTKMGGDVNKLKATFQKIKDSIVKFANAVKQGFVAILPHIKKGAATILNFGKSVIKTIKKIPSVIKSLPKTFAKAFNKMGGDTEAFKEKFRSITNSLKNIWKNLKTLFSTACNAIKNKFGELKNSVSKHSGKIKGAIRMVKSVFVISFDVIKGVLSNFVTAASDILQGLFTALDGVIEFITGVFTSDWSKAWNGVKKIFKGIFESFVGLAKTPINAVIGIINGVISGINNLGFTIPDWIPKIGGEEFSVNIPTIPMLYKGTTNWAGGIAMVHDRGAEIIDLPKGSRVYPHDKSIQMAQQDGISFALHAIRQAVTKVAKDSSVIIPKRLKQAYLKKNIGYEKEAFSSSPVQVEKEKTTVILPVDASYKEKKTSQNAYQGKQTVPNIQLTVNFYNTKVTGYEDVKKLANDITKELVKQMEKVEYNICLGE